MTGFSRSHITHIAVAFAASTLLGSCTGAYKKWSDREVFGILSKKSSRVPNADDSMLSITPPNAIGLEKFKKNLKSEAFLGESAKIEQGAHVITLADALGNAVERNRDYLTRKEKVYMDALDLTLARHQFALIPHAEAAGAHSSVNNEVKVVTQPAFPAVAATATSPGLPAIPEQTVNKFITEHTLTSTGGVGFSALGRAGTKLAADLATDFTRLVTGGGKSRINSSFAATLSQPVLRGAGVLAVTEPLTQTERDVLYSVRTFTQYRKTFAIDTATLFYQTLQSRDEVKNSYVVLQNFKKTLEMQDAVAKANNSPQGKLSQLGLLRQAELNYQRRWINAIKSYEENLDDLKLHLTIPVNERIILDQNELDKLTLIDPDGTLEEAMSTALDSRLDLWNARDTLADSKRHILVAEQDLLPSLNLRGDYNVKGDPNDNGLSLNRKRRDFSVGLDVDLHLDQKPVRNQLRFAQIEEQQSARALELAEETVRKEVRTSWRNLQVARKQYEIAQNALALAEQRLAMESELLPAGRTTPRDYTDAQTALADSRNQIVAALVNHTIARIQLYKDMGVLFIRKDGGWVDVLKKESIKGTHP